MSTLIRKPVLHLVLIALATCLAYANSLSVPFIFDDQVIIENNLFIQDARFLAQPSLVKGSYLYYPLRLRYVSLLSFAVDFHLWGLNPWGYHLTNLIIHLLSAFLVYGLISLIFATPRLAPSALQRHAPLIAVFTSLLFALHPVQTQAVTYIVQRYMSLAALFYLLSLFLYVKWRLASLEVKRLAARGFGGILAGLYLLSLAAALLGLKTKEICLTLPLALGFCEFLFFEGKRAPRLFGLLPFLLATLLVPLSLLELADLSRPWADILRQISRKSFIATEATSREYLLTQFTVLVTYLRLLILPVNQNLDYDYPLYRSFFDPPVFLSFLFLAAILGLTAYLLYRYREREPVVRLLAFGVFLFFLAPAVESSLMPMIDVINEHRLYLSTAGFFTALVTGIFWGLSRWEARRPALPLAVALFLLTLAGVYGVATYLRNQVWQSEITLWEDVIKKSPRKARPYDELGLAHARQGRYSEAVPLYQQAIALNPRFATYYSNLGVAYGSLGDPEKARQMFEQALLVDPGNAHVHNNLGVLYLRQKRLKEAEEMFRRALAISPGDAVAQKNLKLLQGRPSP